MKTLLMTISLAFGAVSSAFAQTPVITDVLDAGGYTETIAQGTLFVVKGTNLCTTTAQAAAPYKTTALGGVTIQLTPVSGGAAVSAYMESTYCQGGVTQLAAVLPSDTAVGDYNVTVTVTPPGTTSAPFKTTVVLHKVGIMTQNGSGSGRALAQDVVSATQYDLNGFTTGPVPGAGFQRSPAYPGEVMIAWGMGLGSALGFDDHAPPGGFDFIAQHLDVKAIVGGQPIVPIYAGRSNLFAALDNITFRLPDNVQTGCLVSFQVSVAGQLSNLTTLAIAPNAQAGACQDPLYTIDVLKRFDAGGGFTVGDFNLISALSTITIAGQSITSRSESASGAFTTYNADQLVRVPEISAAPSGVCQVYTFTSGQSAGGAAIDVTNLDAGAITLNGPNVANKALTETNKAYYLSLTTPGSNTPVISAGTYTLTGAGGTDIGPFTASILVSPPLTVTGGLPATVNRSQNLPIAWTGGGTALVEIIGSSALLISGSSSSNNAVYTTGTFICTTTADKGSFSVPSSILQQLPPTPANAFTAGTGFGSLAVYSSSLPNAASKNGYFTAPVKAGGNIDYGIFLAGVGTSALTTYQ